MSDPDPASQTRVDLWVCTVLMDRLVRYARQRGSTPEAILLQSVESFLDGYPIPEPNSLEDRHDDAPQG